VSVQFALSVVLLGGAGLLVSSYAAIVKSDDVLDPNRFMTMRIELPEATMASERREAFYRQLEIHLASTPGVERVTFANVPPFLGAPVQRVTIREQNGNGATRLNAPIVRVGPAYFDALGLPLLRGTSFEPADRLQIAATAIVNHLFAERYFAGQDPIGQQIQVGSAGEAGSGAARADEARWLTVVGVSPTVRQAIASGPRPVVYLPLDAQESARQVILRSSSTAGNTVAAVRTRVAELEESALLVNVRPLAETLRNSRLQPQLIATVLGSLAAVALFLSCVGLYAITSHAVRQRTAEIGLRLALGGTPFQIVWLCMRRALMPIAMGLLVGMAGTFVVGQLLRGLLIGTSATDPTTLAALLVVLTTVTLIACFVPARQGTRVDPATTLRQD
jgi:predicted permease